MTKRHDKSAEADKMAEKQKILFWLTPLLIKEGEKYLNPPTC